MMETKTYNWEIVRFRDCVSYSGTGLDAIKRAPLFDYDTGIRCSRIQDLSQNKPFHEWAFTKTSDKDYKKYQLKKDDILLARTGATIGVSYKIQETLNAVHNNGTIKFRFNSKVDVTFMYGLMQTESFLQYVDNISCVATQPNLRIDVLQKFQFLLPPLPTQRGIASILSTYDALIQNYKRQIAALQSAASELYKEWFVRFRFPGYKNAKFDNGLPVGWKYEQFKDIAKFDRGISYSSDEIDCEDGLNLINLKNIEAFGGFRRDGTKKYNGKYKKEQIVTTDDLVMGITDMTQDRRTVGSVALIPDIEGTCVISADLLKLTTKISNIFVYALCRYGQYSRYFSMFANGANVLHLRPDALLRKKILVPNKELIDKFVSIVSIIIKRTNNLNTEIDNLTTQRDLLLPRLMSGKLSLE